MEIVLLLIAGQCALAWIAGVHAYDTLRLVLPPRDIQGDATLCWIQYATLMGTFAVYVSGIRHVAALKPRTLFAGLIAVTLIAFCACPTTSADVYFYTSLGRVAGVFKLNPYIHSYPYINQDAFSPYVWIRGPSNYGPATLLFFIPSAWLSQIHPALGILFIKLVSAAAHLLTAWLVWRLASAFGRSPARALYLYGFNPVILHELVANGHNDGWAAALALGSLWLLYNERTRLGAILALAPVLIKLSFLVTTGATGVMVLRQKRWGAIAWVGIASFVIWMVCDPLLHESLHQLSDPRAVGAVNAIYAGMSGAMQVWGGLPAAVANGKADALIRPMAYGYAAFALWRCTKMKDVQSVVDELALLLLLLVLFAARIWPWYLAWMVPFAILARSPAVRVGAVVATASYPLLYVPLWDLPRRSLVILFVVLAPALVWLVVAVAPLRRRFRKSSVPSEACDPPAC